ncbi:2-oxoacid:acceptor oxidoreductase delta subunit (pyruvate/2-ketoisovalerate family) [Kribbella orskensis]|uniref:2-oxoacid:acceptor oxidoreductase delta subunit (Pyruvate/2-ketoisovalerate family) n=1 Tax=Kribbella orskensis TaxID=2512216 RepID=A0ABY2BNT7_9ACTN|nr:MULTISPECIES: NAD(P)-binding protein [Kribbella]TCN42202.1 2-oxoacid:acceptor oxidoreductase delta subunit (pyruvate/2-ketoisovalerate family) [Kribbella sp. VKM Ac-2500]TCO26080.1 2-oxoacid:acceptor oxidoreductase delta subunit (pyruvate/2-ketoisovalerate family) [Kribbella orskensis]
MSEASKHGPLPFAITLDVGSSLANKTGSWRTEVPAYVDRLPPCNDACPAGENIQQWLHHAEEAGYEAAWRQIMADNPFPAIMGRVCYRPCETACNRATLDEAVGINSVERFLGDEAIEQGWTVPVEAEPTGKQVLVVGAGPSGLAVAYHLTLLGHQVTVRDSCPEAGGMMRYGIPAYRLPREVVDAEIQRIVDLGVRLELGTTVTDLEVALSSFDAVFLAVGAHLGRRADIPAGDSAHILDAVSVLAGLEEGEQPLLGRRVAVYGGGNTALDVARTARRLGATDAVVVYRRTRDRMPAHDIEVKEALEEGIRMRWLSTIAYAGAGQIKIEKMKLDETGFPQPTGEFEELAADSVVLALGQLSDLTLVEDLEDVTIADGVVQVGKDLMTGHPGLFAGGDMVPSERTVTVAVGHGKKAARSIDAWLRGTADERAARHELATYDRLNTWYYADAPATVRPRLDLARRIATFDEVTGGLDASTALFEARRCMSCGNCLECDNCFSVCPDNAVIKLGPGRYEIDLDFCKGCGLCAAECPSGAIEMFPERL